MKHIDKTRQQSLQGKAILDNWVNSHQPIINQLSTQENTRALWRIFDKKTVIRAYLNAEQGGLCCYCGRELTQMTHYIVIEHLKLKSLKSNNTYPNMFDYDNLLCSCHGNSYGFYEVKNGDTWASIALKSECTFSNNKVAELKRMNPDIDVGNNEPKAGETLIVGFVSGADKHHCDNFRGDKPLRINPIQLPNCIDRFIYTVKERHNTGGVKPHVNDIEAEEAVINLNLNASILLRERAKIVEDTAILLEEISITIEENRATSRQEIIDIAHSYLSVIKGFYVVYRAYFKDDFPELFQD